MLLDILIPLLTLLLGLRGMQFYLHKPLKFEPVDRKEGVSRYQDYKKQLKND